MTALPAHDMGPAANAFRNEVRDWLARHWTPERQAAHLQEAVQRARLRPGILQVDGP